MNFPSSQAIVSSRARDSACDSTRVWCPFLFGTLMSRLQTWVWMERGLGRDTVEN